MFRVDTRRAEKQQAFNAVPISRMNYVVLNHKIAVDKISRISIIGVNSTDSGGGKENVFRFLGRKKGFDISLAGQVKLCKGAVDEVGVTVSAEFAGES